MNNRNLRLFLNGLGIIQSIRKAISLNLLDTIRKHPYSTKILANLLGLQEFGLDKLLYFLKNIDVLYIKNNRWYLTKSAELFASSKLLVSEFMLLSSKEIYNSWDELEYSISTGKPAFESLYRKNFFEYLGSNPEIARIYHEGWVGITLEISKTIIKKYNFEKYNKIIEIGGANGALLLEILKHNIHLEGVLIEKNYMQNSALLHIENNGLSDRCNFVLSEQFFDVGKKADIFLMKSFIHLFNDQIVLDILKHCYTNLPLNGRILVIERLLDKNKMFNQTIFTDMIMFLVTGGQERSKESVYNLFLKAKISPLKSILLPHGFILYEGVKK